MPSFNPNSIVVFDAASHGGLSSFFMDHKDKKKKKKAVSARVPQFQSFSPFDGRKQIAGMEMVGTRYTDKRRQRRGCTVLN